MAQAKHFIPKFQRADRVRYERRTPAVARPACFHRQLKMFWLWNSVGTGTRKSSGARCPFIAEATNGHLA
jgi:hypothetical protein